MTDKEKAVNYFNSGFNCSQAVLATLAVKSGLNESTCMKLATGFGGGMGRKQSVCGAVTGAIMAIGLKYGNNETPDKDRKENTYQIVTLFIKEFEKRNKSINCIDILGYDMKTEEGYKKIKENKLFEKTCTKCLQDAIEIVNTLITD